MKNTREVIIPDIDYQAEVKKCKTMEDVVGKNGLMQKLFKEVIEQLLEVEMEEHLNRGKYERYNTSDINYRNVYSSKTISSSFGDVGLDIPRDRKSQFEPKVVEKYEIVCNDLKNRGLNDILIACMDGLKGLPEAIKTVYPDVSIQTCIIHQIRNSFKYIASKDQKEFTK